MEKVNKKVYGQKNVCARFNTPSVQGDVVSRLETELGISNLFARILAARGFTDSQAVERFTTPSLERDWKDPFALPGMDQVADRVVRAIDNGEHICIFGDYDLDGVSATATLERGLRIFGANVESVLPLRLEDGYGLSASAVDRIAKTGADLVITVDCGISAAPEVDLLLKKGIDVVVTDHHEPGDLIPQGIPVCDPKLDENYRADGGDLSGSGVALKLVQAVGGLVKLPCVWRGLVDLAALGTVADVMPLTGENRALVAAGVEKIRLDPNVGIAALCTVARSSYENMTAEKISFNLAPRLNAAGRVASPVDSLRLLMTDKPAEAAELAAILDEHNKARQFVEGEMSKAVFDLLEKSYRGEPAIVLAQEGWHDGVKGIVASRVAHTYNVPTILCSIEDGVAVGSARSVGTIDLFKALEACSGHLMRYGGHAGAAGLAVSLENIDDFRSALYSHLESLPDDAYDTVDTIDAVSGIDELSIAVAHELERLEPFGEANPRPTLMSHAVDIKNACVVGKDAKHLKFQASQNGSQVPAICFRCPEVSHVVQDVTCADVVYRFEIDYWQGRERIQLMVRNLVELHEVQRESDVPEREFLVELFDHAEETFVRKEYAGILDAAAFFTKLSGVTYEGRQEAIALLEIGDSLELKRDPLNEFDDNAIGVYSPRLARQIGFLNKDLAAQLAPAIDAGEKYEIELSDITGGREERQSLGVNVRLSRVDASVLEEEKNTYRISRRAEFETMPQDRLEECLRHHFIGENKLHSAQIESLRKLDAGRNVLTVMATGRGKSLIFHIHAAKIALLHHRASVFVYPLRALVADQAFHLEDAFLEFGLKVAVVTGESSESTRAQSFEELRCGELDIILTTPEFLSFHSDEFARANRVGFVVVDEAHHIAQARAGNRPAYARLGEAIASLSTTAPPVTLAVTATASDEVADQIAEVLDIHERVLDPTVRDNMVIADFRNCEHKESYLLDLAHRGEKMVVYVNSREESVKLARAIRKAVPELAWKTAFYNGGLKKAVRHEIERRFRTDEMLVCIATSAFGEGVNIPDIRHVVLYHMPFSDIEFNQMAGRAGRDGRKATIHLLFGDRDSRINESILSSLAPKRDALAAVYKTLKDTQDADGPAFNLTNADIAERAAQWIAKDKGRIDEQSVSTGLGVFRELGLVKTTGHSSARRIEVVPTDEKLDLNSSTRYSEGRDEIESFAQFKDWVTTAKDQELLERFNKPILPSK
ncbi:MAG: single-stranded-DNA-specific exonuclease RecJ [Coriobacteriia bacterium]|nr:single-stranded-DNA-specific exonuclease RecJ [Coriobacteriia bacterium]